MDNVFTKLFPSVYELLKKKTGKVKFTDVNSTNEFIEKLEYLKTTAKIPINKRCGRHLLIAHLTRNFSVHQRGLSGNVLWKNLSLIYSSLMKTLIVVYAGYKKQ